MIRALDIMADIVFEVIALDGAIPRENESINVSIVPMDDEDEPKLNE